MTDRIINKTSLRDFPAMGPERGAHRASGRRCLYGDIPEHRQTHLRLQIDEQMRRLNVAVLSRQLLDQTIEQIESRLATLIGAQDRLSDVAEREVLDAAR